MAPGILQGSYDESCDLWAAGCILYVMLSGYEAFHGESEAEILESVKAGKIEFDTEEWDTVSDDAKDLICKLINP